MIVLSVGMPRAGSGWYYNLTHDLISATGGQDARQIRKRYHLQSILTEINCNIGALTPRRLTAVMIPSLLGNTFTIKTHAGLSPFARKLIQRGQILPSYIYRDPRDAMLSAMDYGQRALQKGRTNVFSDLVDFETSMDFMMSYLRIWDDWILCAQALHHRYEDLLLDYENEVQRLIAFLNLDIDNPNVQAISVNYSPGQRRKDQKGLHFSKGKIGRFRERTTPEQQKIMLKKFGPYLDRMGYDR